MFDIELLSDSSYEKHREQIRLMVEKRNKIIHEGDEASDITGQTVMEYLEMVRSYAETIDKIVTVRFPQK